MKNRPMTIAVVLIAAAALSFGLCRYAHCARAGVSLDVLNNTSWLTASLGLTRQQAKDVRALQRDLHGRLEACRSMDCAARCRLVAVLFSGTNGTADAEAMVESMCKAHAEAEKATLEHIQKVYQLLRPEQQHRYKELVSACVCPTCPTRSP